MSAVIRAYGANFDVDAFLAGCTLPVCAVHRRGEPVLPGGRRDRGRQLWSGVTVAISDTGFDELPRQVAEATAFLRTEAEQLRRLCAFPGVEGVMFDIGIARRDVAAQFDYLPPELIRLAGALGLGIELSHFMVADEEPDA